MGEQGAGTSTGERTSGTPMIGAPRSDTGPIPWSEAKKRIDFMDFTPTKEEIQESKFERALYDVLEEASALLLTKHRDYGPRNISLSPGGPLNGLRVRMWDKIARINNLIETGADPQHEGLRDSFIDCANYAVIACLVLQGDWPDQ